MYLYDEAMLLANPHLNKKSALWPDKKITGTGNDHYLEKIIKNILSVALRCKIIFFYFVFQSTFKLQNKQVYNSIIIKIEYYDYTKQKVADAQLPSKNNQLLF